MGNDIKIEPGSMWFRADDFNAKVNILTADGDVVRYQYLKMNDHGDLSLGRADRDQFLNIFIKWDDEYERFRLGSIWEAVQGCAQTAKGKKIKITSIFGDIVGWVFLDNFEKTEDHCTCKSTFIRIFTRIADNDNGAIYRSIEPPIGMVKVKNTKPIFSISPVTVHAFTGVEYTDIKPHKYSESHITEGKDFHAKYELFSLNPEKEFAAPLSEMPTPLGANEEETNIDDKIFTERLELEVEGSWWKRIEDDAIGVILEIRNDNSNNLIVRWTHPSFEGSRAGAYDRYEFVRKWVPIDPVNTIKEENKEMDEIKIGGKKEDKSLLVKGTWWKNKKNGSIGLIIDIKDKKGLVIFRFQSGVVWSFNQTEFLKEFEIITSDSKSAPESNVNNEITVGSIWRNTKGAEEYKGRLIKVFHINGDSISWRYLANAEGCPKIGPNRRSTKTTSESLFLYAFEKVQDNDNGAIYQPFDRVHDARENPGKYQMVKVVETNTDRSLSYGTIKYITTPVSSSVYSVTLEEFHSEFELFSLNPAEEFSTDTNDSNDSGKRIDPNKGESKMENNNTYLKTDKDKLEDFGTGAKREDKSGKGRYDLIPGDVMQNFEDFCWAYYFSEGPTTCSATDVSKSAYFDDWSDVDSYYDFILNMISYFFVSSCDKEECEDDLGEVSYSITWDGFRKGIYEMRKALAKHYEAGAVVHGVDNWKKGLPVYGSERGGCFLDSMRRHADQALMGKTDEPHAVAAIWNAVGAVWTLNHIPKSAICQNASTTKADEKPKNAHFDMIDSCIGALKYMNKDKDHLSATKIITPFDKKFTIRKWPEGFEPVVDFEKEALMKEMLDYPSYNDFIKSVREANEKEKFDIMHQWCYAHYNLYKCIEVLRSIVKNDKFSKLDSRVTTVYFNIYMIFKTIYRIFVMFQEDSEAIKQILKIISDFHIMINLNVGHIGRCCDHIRLNWETYSPEYLRTFECAGSVPDEDEINILYEMIGRTGSVLLHSDEKEKLDYFCGLEITRSLLEFNTKFLKDRVYNNKK